MDGTQELKFYQEPPGLGEGDEQHHSSKWALQDIYLRWGKKKLKLFYFNVKTKKGIRFSSYSGPQNEPISRASHESPTVEGKVGLYHGEVDSKILIQTLLQHKAVHWVSCRWTYGFPPWFWPKSSENGVMA